MFAVLISIVLLLLFFCYFCVVVLNVRYSSMPLIDRASECTRRPSSGESRRIARFFCFCFSVLRTLNDDAATFGAKLRAASDVKLVNRASEQVEQRQKKNPRARCQAAADRGALDARSPLLADRHDDHRNFRLS